MSATEVSQWSVVLSVGDTTYLDYGQILAKREGYGPQGKGGNGLLLHSALEEDDPHRLWEKLKAQPIVAYYEVELSETKQRKARTATLAIRFCPVHLQVPPRLGTDSQLQVYAVYAHEVNCPEDEEPVSWMLLTSEAVTTSNCKFKI